MSNQIQMRRGTDAQRQTIILNVGELAFTTDLKQLWMGDGVTMGGILVGLGVAGTALAAAFWTQAGTNLSAAGTIALANTQTWGVGRLPFSLAAGSGAYVANLTLSDANVLAGALLRIPVDFPASGNPTLNIYDSSTAGTLLEGPLVNPNPGAPTSFLFTAGYDGSNWHKESGQWID